MSSHSESKSVREFDECPLCSKTNAPVVGLLNVREGYRGGFLGCSRFPDCRYTADLPENDVSVSTLS